MSSLFHPDSSSNCIGCLYKKLRKITYYRMTGCILTTCIILLCPFRLHAADNKDKSIFWLIPFASFSGKNIKPEGQNFTYNAMQLIGMEETKLTSNDQVIIKPEDIEKINNLIQKKYSQLSINSAQVKIKSDLDGDKEYILYLDISDQILSISSPGTDLFGKILRYIKDCFTYSITAKLDSKIRGYIYKTTINGEDIIYPQLLHEEAANSEQEYYSSFQSTDSTLLKKLIMVNPAHGYYYDNNDSQWKFQRTEYNGVLEDLKTSEIGIQLKEILSKSEDYKSMLTRFDSKDETERGESGKLKYAECARQYIKSILPYKYDIWDTASSNNNYDKDINARPRYANFRKADLLLSIHTNGTDLWGCAKKGTKLFFSGSNDSKDNSKYLAKILSKVIVDRIKEKYDSSWPTGTFEEAEEYGENNLANMPSAIIEVAYHDCSEPDAKALKDPEFIKIVNDAIKEGVDIFYSSYMDGVGSVVRPNNDCWGCQHDEARMHPHYVPSTVAFQWLSTGNCDYLKLGIAKNSNSGSIGSEELDVFIHTKKWDSSSGTTFAATLPVAIKQVDTWNTTAITTQLPIKETKRIIAECSSSPYGKSTEIDKRIVTFANNYYWTGNASLIARDNFPDLDSQDAGVRQDWAVTSPTNKSLAVFQWQPSSKCSKLKLSGGFDSSDGSLSTNQIGLKSWSSSRWPDENYCGGTLPCELSTSNYNSYYLVKVKTNAGIVPSNYLHAECISE